MTDANGSMSELSGENVEQRPVLVIGANGFLGSRLTRLLVRQRHNVRVMIRSTASRASIQDLPVRYFYGDIFDSVTLQHAIADCRVVYYCVVDARAWLRDPAPLFRTNVDGLRNVLEVVRTINLERFVFTSSYVTIGRRKGLISTEAESVDPQEPNPYVRSRVEAEALVQHYAREYGVPAVAMCVSMTFGPGDWGRTPHGELISRAALGQLFVVPRNISVESVGIDDAAHAMVLAADRGTNGERYIVSERMATLQELCEVAAQATGVRPPRPWISPALMLGVAGAGATIAKVLGRDWRFGLRGMRLLLAESELDHSKAVRELGWSPRPIEESIREAAWFWSNNAKLAPRAVV